MRSTTLSQAVHVRLAQRASKERSEIETAPAPNLGPDPTMIILDFRMPSVLGPDADQFADQLQ